MHWFLVHVRPLDGVARIGRLFGLFFSHPKSQKNDSAQSGQYHEGLELQIVKELIGYDASQCRMLPSDSTLQANVKPIEYPL